MQPEHQLLIQIRDLIHRYFNLEEFRTLCFDLGVSYDDLGGEGLQARARELVALCDRTGRLDHLLTLCGQHRPHAHWPERNNLTGRLIMPAPLTPPVQNRRQIFVSYAHQDAEFAQRLATDLHRAGWDIWIAPQSIRPGERWVTAINRGLGESGIFLLVLTPAAAQSQWVQMETDAAIELAHHGEIRFIPLQVQPTHQPPLWRTYQWISFQGEYLTGWEQLMQALHGKLAGPILRKTEVTSTLGIPKAGVMRVWQKDDKMMVYIPTGEFLYGEDQHKIHLGGFWIDKTPVTNAEYKRFLDAHPKQRIPFVNEGWAEPYNWDKKRRSYPMNKSNHPVVLVSWYDAQAYAKWAGKRLPTEKEWEKAARGTDGREYPWGVWQDGHANTEEAEIGGTCPVGQFSPQGDSPYGCVDMAGNVWEWVEDWHEKGNYRVLRGGSWYGDRAYCRCTTRDGRDSRYYSRVRGFRCCIAHSSGFSF